MRENFTTPASEKDKHPDKESTWRIFRIMTEFVDGFELLQKYELAATFFGSSKCELGDQMYQDAEGLAAMLVKEGYTIITGGGPGIMEAANKGALEAGGHSVGLNIELPDEQSFNSFTNDSEDFHYFFTRKVMLSFASEVYIFFPGGYGTLDELFEMLMLVQTKKIQPIPIILYGKEYWGEVDQWFKKSLLEKYKTINPEDVRLYQIVDTVKEALEVIKNEVTEQHLP